MRCEQATTLGFEAIDSAEMVKMIMGEEHTHKDDEVGERQTHEFFYNHITGTTLAGDDCNWGGQPSQLHHMYKKNPWYMPPFVHFEKWRCQFGKLDYIKREIPYGVVLRLNEVKKLNLFNVFNIMAPMEAWERKTDIDPIVVATIWSIADENGKAKQADQVQHFFLAQW
jgi:myosin-crossreactive antigen